MKSILKVIYRGIPFKKQIYILMRSVWRPPERLYKHLHFVGNMKVKVDEQHSFKMRHYGYLIENEIFWNGIMDGWEKYSLRIWKKLAEKCDVIVDVGANTGVYSLLAKSINETADVYAFDPIDRVFDKLLHNVSLNNYDITCIKKALSDANGEALIYDTNTEHTYSGTVNKNMFNDTVTVIPTNIQTITLDSFIKEQELTKLDLIKIDVETHEVEVLEGFKEHLHKFQPTMIIEVLNDEVAHGIQRLLDGMGYVYYNIDENNGIRKVPSLTKSDYYNFLICQPQVAAEIGLS